MQTSFQYPYLKYTGHATYLNFSVASVPNGGGVSYYNYKNNLVTLACQMPFEVTENSDFASLILEKLFPILPYNAEYEKDGTTISPCNETSFNSFNYHQFNSKNPYLLNRETKVSIVNLEDIIYYFTECNVHYLNPQLKNVIIYYDKQFIDPSREIMLYNNYYTYNHSDFTNVVPNPYSLEYINFPKLRWLCIERSRPRTQDTDYNTLYNTVNLLSIYCTVPNPEKIKVLEFKSHQDTRYATTTYLPTIDDATALNKFYNLEVFAISEASIGTILTLNYLKQILLNLPPLKIFMASLALLLPEKS